MSGHDTQVQPVVEPPKPDPTAWMSKFLGMSREAFAAKLGTAITNRDANAEAPWEMFDFTNPPFMTPPAIPIPADDPAVIETCSATWGTLPAVDDPSSGGTCQ